MRSALRPTTPRLTTDAAPESELELATVIAEDIVERDTAPPTLPAASARAAARTAHPRTRVKPGSLLAARAATEYVYVAQDLRRIVVVSALLFGIMLALYLLIVVARVIPLPFY